MAAVLARVRDGELLEARSAAPIEIYPEYRVEGGGYTLKNPDGSYRIEAVFAEIDTDEGVTGAAGPISAAQAITPAGVPAHLEPGQPVLSQESDSTPQR